MPPRFFPCPAGSACWEAATSLLTRRPAPPTGPQMATAPATAPQPTRAPPPLFPRSPLPAPRARRCSPAATRCARCPRALHAWKRLSTTCWPQTPSSPCEFFVAAALVPPGAAGCRYQHTVCEGGLGARMCLRACPQLAAAAPPLSPADAHPPWLRAAALPCWTRADSLCPPAPWWPTPPAAPRWALACIAGCLRCGW